MGAPLATSAGLDIGQPHANRSMAHNMYLKDGDPGLQGGGTLTGTNTEPTLAMWENVFGPAGRDVKLDSQRHKRHQRWHLPDVLKGHNQFLTDRIDGLITDATNSPFTRNILPYVYLENPDQKLKWNVYSFDEGIASRVPYEAAARVLPQTKRSFAGYVVRQGLAIAMEHNFMVSAAGRENFQRQLTQLVGSIQLTNDLDVHVALLQAPSYQKFMNERYHDQRKTTPQICREYVDLFGILQKVPNALDILIEDAKNTLKTWGSPPPTFLLCNGALTTQLQMTPEKTNYLTNGPDGAKRLAEGPTLNAYRGLSIINSRKFSMDAGTAPRDLLRRRVRVAEYYHIPWSEKAAHREYEFYDQSRDTMFRLSWKQLLAMADISANEDEGPVLASSEHWISGPPGKRRHTVLLANPFDASDGGKIVYKPMRSWDGLGVSALLGGIGLDMTNPDTHTHSQLRLRQEFGCVQLPAPIVRADDQYAPKKARISDVLCETTGSLPSFLVVPSKRPELVDLHLQSETFGMGLFNNVLVPEAPAGNTANDQLQALLHHYAHHYDILQRKHVVDIQDGNANADFFAQCRWKLYEQLTGTVQPYIETAHEPLVSRPKAAGLLAKFGAYTTADADEKGPAGSSQRKLWLEQTMRCDMPAPDINSPVDDNIYANLQRHLGFAEGILGNPGDFDRRPALHYFKHLVETWWYCVMEDKLQDLMFNDVVDGRKDYQNISVLQKRAREIYCHFAVLVAADPQMGAVNVPGTAAEQRTLVSQIRSFWPNLDEIETNLMYVLQLPRTMRARNANQSVFAAMPNLHINTCTELREEDMATSATSLNPVAWHVQQLAGMAKLSRETSEHLLGSCSNSGLQGVDAMVKNFFVGFAGDDMLPLHNGGNAEDNTRHRLDQHINMPEYIPRLNNANVVTTLQSSFLEMWVAAYFHPSESVREVCLGAIDLSFGKKKQFFDAFADALDRNTGESNALDQALCNLVPPNFSHTARSLPVGTGRMASMQWCVPAYVSCSKFQKPDINKTFPWEQVPVADKDHFRVIERWHEGNGHADPLAFRTAVQTAMMLPRFHEKGFGLVNADGTSRRDDHGWYHPGRRYGFALARRENALARPPVNSPLPTVQSYNGNMQCYMLHEGRQAEADPSPVHNCKLAHKFPWMAYLPKTAGLLGMPCPMTGDREACPRLWDPNSAQLQQQARSAAEVCRDPAHWDEMLRHIVLVLAARMFCNTSMFCGNGRGVGIDWGATQLREAAAARAPPANPYEGLDNTDPFAAPEDPAAPGLAVGCRGSDRMGGEGEKYLRNGRHFMHGPWLPVVGEDTEASGPRKDIVILRPNIEHEMLGVIMGRGGTQELGCTFWGQTELSCYDDAQHGIWGMSYKYHQRAMVTNERNLIRVFDVAFDGYNGGMDQRAVNWNEPRSLDQFRQATYARDTPYDGPSMLVMALPHERRPTRCDWPNPVVFHHNVTGNPSPDPMKDNVLPDIEQYMVFSHERCPTLCTAAQEQAYKRYMDRLQMQQWASLDQSSRPAGENCIANETSSSMLAFQGTMKVYDCANGQLVEHIQGSGHLGPSYVGVASIREGRGIQNAAMQPHMVRQI